MQNFNEVDDVEEEEDDVFFDSVSRIGSPVDDERLGVEHNLQSEFWRKDLMSVRERRKRLFTRLGLNELVSSPISSQELERITEDSGAVLDSTVTDNNNNGPQKELVCCIRDLDSGKKFIIDDLFSTVREVGSDRIISIHEFETLLGLSRSVQRFFRREPIPSDDTTSRDGAFNRRKKKARSWLSGLLSRRHMLGICRNDVAVKSSLRPMRVKVSRHKKRCLEFTAMYMGQEIRAHKGLIRTMKFNQSGNYLASGGEDCVARVWQVREVEASCTCSSADGSCKYLDRVKEKKLMLARKGANAAPIVIPNKVFKINETLLHEFRGHTSEILDLSWSSSDCLLTSSMDKTIRMWKVGCDGCLKVFQHSDYVTSVQFNPVDNEYFISGSIDGKVRIWSVSENHVVDWADIRDIVTALCYLPDGKGFVVGSIRGNCRFYHYSGDTIQLDTQFFIEGRKKSAGKPITGLQFSPEDLQRVMVTSADSKLRIFDGVSVVSKFRGLRKAKSQLSASFTSDGRYIVSVGEDSNVYIWNYDLSGSSSSKGVKSVKSIRTCEHFSSEGASVAIPWPGIGKRESRLSNISLHLPSQPLKIFEPSTWLWDSDFCSIGAWLFADGISRGSATWPEEKLPASPNHSSQLEHDYCQHRDRQYLKHHNYHRLTYLSASWSFVIVTASCDGTIRTFHNYGLPVRL